MRMNDWIKDLNDTMSKIRREVKRDASIIKDDKREEFLKRCRKLYVIVYEETFLKIYWDGKK